METFESLLSLCGIDNEFFGLSVGTSCDTQQPFFVPNAERDCQSANDKSCTESMMVHCVSGLLTDSTSYANLEDGSQQEILQAPAKASVVLDDDTTSEISKQKKLGFDACEICGRVPKSRSDQT